MTPAQLADQADALAAAARSMAATVPAVAEAVEPFVFLLAIFLMACVTNAISSVIVVGAMLATGLALSGWAMGFGFIAVTLASVNIFGGFVVTQRMLQMFKKKAR
jgi:NAD(P) transhydrogenase subunit alpha